MASLWHPMRNLRLLSELALLVAATVACGGAGDKTSSPPVPGRAVAGTTGAIAGDIAPTLDGGFIVVGTIPTPGHGTDLLLVRVDPAGTVVWSATYGGAGNETGSAVRQTTDGGFVAAGTTDDVTLGGGPGGILLVRTNSAGAQTWIRSYGGVDPLVQLKKAGVRQAQDGGFAVAGTVPGIEFNPEPDALLVRTDTAGDVVWEARVGNEGGNTWAEGRDVEALADGGFILAGTHRDRPGMSFAVKVNAAGAKVWDQTFDPTTITTGLTRRIDAVQEIPGGGQVYFGKHDGSTGACAMLLARGDAAGGLVWEGTVGPETACGGSVVQGRRTADGGFVAVSTGGGNNGEAYVVRATATGSQKWAATYGGAQADSAVGVVERAGGGLAVVGSTQSFGPDWAIYLLLLDAAGVAR